MAADPVNHAFERPPTMAWLYARAALKRGVLGEGRTIPRIEATLAPQTPPGEELAAYREVCGFVPSDQVPPTWPHVLSAPMHLSILTDSTFPIRPLGIVHTRNLITVHKPLPQGVPLGVRCWVEGHRQHRLGVEFDLETEVGIDAETVWASTTTILARVKGRPPQERPPREAPTPGVESGLERSCVWKLPASQGRSYARVSGDFNPIHLYPWTAKALGFRRQIVHGMWSLARCLAEVEEDLPDTPWSVSATFRKPVLLPSPVLFTAGREGDRLTFGLRTRDAARVHLEGEVRSDGQGREIRSLQE